jgi:hypothetical protein
MRDENGNYKYISLFPANDAKAAMKKATNAMGKAGEHEALRVFYYKMKFFFDIAIDETGDLDPDIIPALYEYAKKGIEWGNE